MKILYILTIIPFLGILGFLPFVNRVEPFILGLPSMMFWLVMWTVLTSIILGIMYKIDPRNQRGDDR